MKTTDARRLRMSPAGLAVAALSVVVVLALGGCSGAGMQSSALTSSSTQQVAAAHMTTVQLLRSWLTVMYPPPSDPPAEPDVRTVKIGSDPATYHMWGTDSYGRDLDYVYQWFGPSVTAGTGWYHTPAGARVKTFWERPTSMSPRVEHIVHKYPDMTLDYVFTAQTDQEGFYPEERVGSMVLRDGRALEFGYHDNARGEHRLELRLPAEGIMVQVQVPVVFRTNRGSRPKANAEATGEARTPATALTFALHRVPGAWDQWTLSGSDGVSATFALDASLGGGGRLERAGKLLGLLNWPADLVGRLDLTTVGVVEVTPVAAARDLAIEKWVAGLAGLGPMPIP